MLSLVSWKSKYFFSFRNHFPEDFKGTTPFFFSILPSPYFDKSVSFWLFFPIPNLTLYMTICFPSGSFSLTLTFLKFTTMWLGYFLDPFNLGHFLELMHWFFLKLLLDVRLLALMSRFCIFTLLFSIFAIFFFPKEFFNFVFQPLHWVIWFCCQNCIFF